jgi:hypothetical protein
MIRIIFGPTAGQDARLKHHGKFQLRTVIFSVHGDYAASLSSRHSGPLSPRVRVATDTNHRASQTQPHCQCILILRLHNILLCTSQTVTVKEWLLFTQTPNQPIWPIHTKPTTSISRDAHHRHQHPSRMLLGASSLIEQRIRLCALRLNTCRLNLQLDQLGLQHSRALEAMQSEQHISKQHTPLFNVVSTIIAAIAVIVTLLCIFVGISTAAPVADHAPAVVVLWYLIFV